MQILQKSSLRIFLILLDSVPSLKRTKVWPRHEVFYKLLLCQPKDFREEEKRSIFRKAPDIPRHGAK